MSIDEQDIAISFYVEEIEKTEQNEFNIDEKITSIRKINNPNIIKIIDIINYKFAVYIIRENITDNDNYNFCEISNIENLSYYKIILASIKYLLDLKIEIDVIKIDNIYIVDNQIIINTICDPPVSLIDLQITANLKIYYDISCISCTP